MDDSTPKSLNGFPFQSDRRKLLGSVYTVLEKKKEKREGIERERETMGERKGGLRLKTRGYKLSPLLLDGTTSSMSASSLVIVERERAEERAKLKKNKKKKRDGKETDR